MFGTKLGRYLQAGKNLSFRERVRLGLHMSYYLCKTTLGRDRFVEARVNDYRMLLDLRDKGISKELILLATRERDQFAIINEVLAEGMTVLDIGANIGYYSILMGRLVGPKGKVYAVEPAVANYHLLCLNVRLNELEDVVETFNIGISNKNGVAPFYESEKSNWHTFYPQVHGVSSTECLVNRAPIMASVTTIQEFIKGKRPVDFIRMDIEGYEVEVLESLIGLLRSESFSPRILFEVHQPRYDERLHSLEKPLNHLFEEGYYPKTLTSREDKKNGANPFHQMGYMAQRIIKTDFLRRGLYRGISGKDAIDLMCHTDCVRAALLERRPTLDKR